MAIAELGFSARAYHKSLKVARGTVQNRLAKLERDGIIAGYTIRLKPKIDEQGIVARHHRCHAALRRRPLRW